MLACTGSAVGVKQKVTEAMKRTTKHLLITATVFCRDVRKWFCYLCTNNIYALFFTISDTRALVSVLTLVCWKNLTVTVVIMATNL